MNNETLLFFLFATSVIGSGVGYHKIWLFHIAMVFFVISYFFLKNQENNCLLIWPKSLPLKIFGIFITWYFLSISWTINLVYSLRYLGYLLLGSTLMFLIAAYAATYERFSKALQVFKTFFFLAIVIGILESVTPIRLPTSSFFEYAGLFGRAMTDLNALDTGHAALITSMPTSFWGNPNNFALAIALVMPFFYDASNKIFRYRFIATIVIFFLITMTGSRGVFFAAVLGMIFYFYLAGFKKFLFYSLIFIALSPFIPELYETAISSNHPRIREMASTFGKISIYLFEKSDQLDSIGVRQQLILNGMDAFWRSGGLGVGAGGSQAVQEALGGVAGSITAMHNFFVEILVDGGLIGFLLFFIFIGLLFYKLFLIAKNSKSSHQCFMARNLLSSLVIFSVGCISLSSAIYFLPMWILFGLSIALISIEKRQKQFGIRRGF